MKALKVLNENGFKADTNLPYCTESGIEYFTGYKGKEVAIIAIMHDENLYLITKPELREMSLTAKTYGIGKVTLFTNYGIEVHSRLEKLQTVGLTKLIKLCNL